MATKKSATKKKSSVKASAKVGKVMREFKRGQLKSGGKKKVTNPKQAIAIGLSEARQAGAKVPVRKGATTKGAAKKTAAKKAPAKKAAVQKAGRKSVAKKSPSKKRG